MSLVSNNANPIAFTYINKGGKRLPVRQHVVVTGDTRHRVSPLPPCHYRPSNTRLCVAGVPCQRVNLHASTLI